MEYINLIIGSGLIVIFSWFLVKTLKRVGFINALFRIDIIVGIVAGIYLVVSSAHSIIFSFLGNLTL